MVKQAFHTVLTRGFVTVVLVLQSSLWTRLLAPEGRGLYAKLQAGQNFLLLFLGFGLTGGIVYFCSTRKVPSEKLWTLSILLIASGSFLTGLLIILGRLWPDFDLIFPLGYESLFFALYFWFYHLLSQLQLSMNSFLSAEHRFAELNRIEILSTLFRLTVIALAYFVFRDRLTLEILFALDFLAQSIRSVFYYRYFHRLNIPLRLVPISWDVAKPVVMYSIAIYCLSMIQFLYQRVDIWIIEHWSGLAALGIFSSASGLAQYLTILPMALITILVPHLSKASPAEAYIEVGRYSRITSTLLFFPVVIFTIFPEQVLYLIFGSAFVGGAPSLRILALACWFTSTKHIFIYFNASQNRLRANFTIETIGLVLGLALNFWWIPIYGIIGASYSFLVTGIVTQFLSLLSVRRFSRERIYNFFVLTPADLREVKRAL